MARITPAELEALSNKWLAKPLEFRSYLRIALIVAGIALA